MILNPCTYVQSSISSNGFFSGPVALAAVRTKAVVLLLSIRY